MVTGSGIMTRWGELIPHDPDDPACQCYGCDDDREQAPPDSPELVAAAEAIELSVTFREHFTPAHPLGRLHPAALEFAQLALEAAREAPQMVIKFHGDLTPEQASWLKERFRALGRRIR
jgi:hypothetical protein